MNPDELKSLMDKMGVKPTNPNIPPKSFIPAKEETDSPFLVKEPVVETNPSTTINLLTHQETDESADLLSKMGEILREYKGEVGSIPVNHAYWGYLNRFKVLRNK